MKEVSFDRLLITGKEIRTLSIRIAVLLPFFSSGSASCGKLDLSGERFLSSVHPETLS